jgi:hypothetical protein
MSVPIVRGFTERVWLARTAKGELEFTFDESEARAEAAKPGVRVAEFTFVRELHVDRAAANEPPWRDEDLVEEPGARP